MNKDKDKMDNNANQKNPNHDAYWKSRGYSRRPNNWEAKASGSDSSSSSKYQQSSNYSGTTYGSSSNKNGSSGKYQQSSNTSYGGSESQSKDKYKQ